MISQSPLEKVAMAIDPLAWGGPGLCETGAAQRRRGRALRTATTVLTALLDPDEGTLKAMTDAMRGLTFSGYPAEQDRAIFNAAIQHILKGKAGE